MNTPNNKFFKEIVAHDCACISAYRDGIAHGENREGNRRLLGTLIVLGCKIAKIDGSWIEGFGKSAAFFALNMQDDPDFISNLVALGKHFCQDSVLIKEKGEISGYLHLPDGARVDLSQFSGGIVQEFVSRIPKGPLAFSEARDYNAPSKGAIMAQFREELLGA